MTPLSTAPGPVVVPTQIRPRRRDRRTVLDDSRRWDGYVPRRDDVVVSTAVKCGTTWTQSIVHRLTRPDDDTAGFDAVPWLDVRFAPLERELGVLAGMTGVRTIKTHAPADAIPIHAGVRYIATVRDGRDAFVSWMNHRRGMKPEIVAAANELAAPDGVAPWPTTWDGDVEALIDEWIDYGTPGEQLASWWPLRHLPNVLLVHFQDLLDDLDGEMRRIAGHLGVPVDEATWDATVASCRFGALKRAHEGSDGLGRGFDRGNDRFFHRGTNGRWRDVLTSAQARHVTTAVERDLHPVAARWLRAGSSTSGWRP